MRVPYLLLAVVVFLAGYRIDATAQIPVFTDDFPDLSNWILFGTPLPVWVSSAQGRSGIFDNNGDPNYESGAISSQAFTLGNGFTLQSDVFLQFSNMSGCWANAAIGIADPIGQYWGVYEPYIVFYFDAVGDACWGTPESLRRHAYFSGSYPIDGGNSVESFGPDTLNPMRFQGDQFANGWHRMKIIVDNNRVPRFYMDDQLIYAGIQPVAASVLSVNRKLWLGARSSGFAGKAYHDNVSLSLLPPYVLLSSPSGGEDWTIGSQHSVLWSSADVNNIRIEYSTDNGVSWPFTIAASVPATQGSVSWNIPNTPSTQCKVRISDISNPATNSVSTASFCIVKPVGAQGAARILYSSTPQGGGAAYLRSMDSNGQDTNSLASNTGNITSGTWSQDETRIAFSSSASTTGKAEIFVSDANGSTTRQVTSNNDQYGSYLGKFLNRSIVRYVRGPDAGVSDVYEINLDDGGQRRLTFTEYSSMQVGSFDMNLDRRKAVWDQGMIPSWAFSHEIFIADSDFVGQSQRLTFDGTTDAHPSFSPDGSKIAWSRNETGDFGGAHNIYVMNSDGTAWRRLTNVPNNYACVHPLWSPNGRKIIYSYYDGQQSDIHEVDVTDTTLRRNLTNTQTVDEDCFEYKALFSVIVSDSVVRKQSPLTVSWNANGIGQVNIGLSIDGGSTFPYTLVPGTANDGQETVQLPNVAGNSCRIRVSATDDTTLYGVSLRSFIISNISVQGASVYPPANYVGALANQDISLSFDDALSRSSVNNNSFRVRGSRTGTHPGTFSFSTDNKTLTYHPGVPFSRGEVVTVIPLRQITNVHGDSLLADFQSQFFVGGFSSSLGTLRPPAESGAPEAAIDFVLADVDNDGDLDMVSTGPHGIYVYKNNGLGVFTLADSAIINHPTISIWSGDLDNDSYVDIVVANSENPDNVWSLRNDGTGHFSVLNNAPILDFGGEIALGDIDGNGNLDAAIGVDYTDPGVQFFRNDGSGTLRLAEKIQRSTSSDALKFVDLDLDGRLDVVFSQADRQLVVLKNHGSSLLILDTVYALSRRTSQIQFADLNRDHFPDVVIATGQDSIAVLLNSGGSGRFGAPQYYHSDGQVNAVKLADANGDDALDMIAVNSLSSSMTVFYNDGQGRFNNKSSFAAGISPYWAEIGDLNGDGRPDVVLLGGTGTSRTFRFLLGGSLAPTVISARVDSIAPTFCRIKAVINAHSDSTTVRIDYGSTSEYDMFALLGRKIASSSAESVLVSIANLAANTQYHFRVYAHNSGGSDSTTDQTLFTSIAAPTAFTDTATIVGTDTVILRGSVNPNGSNTTAVFDYGRTTNYSDSLRAKPDTVAGSSSQSVWAILPPFVPNADYHCRVRARNSVATSTASDQLFRTPARLANVTNFTTVVAAETTATVMATINPQNSPTSVRVHFGVTTSLGQTINMPSSVSGTDTQRVSLTLGNLLPNQVYYFVWQAENAAGLKETPIWTFRTVIARPRCASLRQDATLVDSIRLLVGSVNPRNSATKVWFEYGSLGNAPRRAEFADSIRGMTDTTFSQFTGSLRSDSTYFFRMVAENQGGIAYGDSLLFVARPGLPSLSSPNIAIGGDTARIEYRVDPQHHLIDTYLEYGLTTSHERGRFHYPSQERDTIPQLVSFTLSNLYSDTAYHFTYYALNEIGTTWMPDYTFRTSHALPVASTDSARPIGARAAVLHARINSRGKQCDVEFVLDGPDGSHVRLTPSNSSFRDSLTHDIVDTAGSLLPSSNYQYKVHLSIPSITPPYVWGESMSFTTKDTLMAPRLLSPSSGDTASNSNLRFSWSSVPGAESYRLQVDTVSTFLQNMNVNETLIDTFRVISSLQSRTRYFWRVRSETALDTSSFAGTASVFAYPPPWRAPVAGSASDIGVTGFIAHWDTVTGTAAYLLDVSSDSTFATLVSGYDKRNVGGVLAYAVRDLAPQTQYYYRVRAKNPGGTTDPSNRMSVLTLIQYPQSFTFGTTITYPSYTNLVDYNSMDYQLVGVPGNSGQSISTFLEANGRGTSWMVYWDNGTISTNPSDYYVNYDGSSGFTASTGKAFWILHRGDWHLSGNNVPSAFIDTTYAVSMPLLTGGKFNLITNPFDRVISWDSVAALNNMTDALYQWQSGWLTTHQMVPYEGYGLYNRSDRSSLRIPWRLISTGSTSLGKSLIAGEGWRLNIAVRSGKYADRTTSLGVLPRASAALDMLDQWKPRAMGKTASAYFYRPEWHSLYDEFASDIRPAVNDIEDWPMTVRSEQRKPFTMEFSNVEQVPEAFAVYLLDEARAKAVNLREQRSYVIKPVTLKTEMHVLVGSAEAVQRRLATIVPTKFELLANYPNPFNPTTTIPIAVPINARVLLEIYNLLGQRVKRLLNDDLEPGRYYIEWDGTNSLGIKVASGAYYCVMRSGEKAALTRKMMMVK